MVVNDQEYRVSELNAAELIRQMPNHERFLESLEGKARAQVSRPGESERATVYFTSSRDSSLLRVRNQLGIEGGRVLSDGDSIIIYDRIDQVAQKFSKEDAAFHYLNGITAMNLVEILNPLIIRDEVEQVFESDIHYLLVMKSGTRFYLKREELVLERTEFTARVPEAFSTFVFENHAAIDGYILPRRIQVLSSDQKSNIFLLIQELDINPTVLNFDLGMPSDITIERL